MNHDPFDTMHDPMCMLHPSCIHMLRWSLKRSVKRTWTGSAFPTNESAWSVLVSVSCVRGPLLSILGWITWVIFISLLEIVT